MSVGHVRAVFYDLQGRITKNIDHTSKGEKIANPYADLTADDLRKLAKEPAPDGDLASDQS